MYILADNILNTAIYKADSLQKITDLLLSKLYSQVFHWDLSKNTYRNVFHAIEDNKEFWLSFKDLNDILSYEIGYKILISNQQ